MQHSLRRGLLREQRNIDDIITEAEADALTDGLVINLHSLRNMAYGVGDVVSSRREYILNGWDEVKANLIALNVGHHIRTVSNINLLDRVEIREYLTARETKERSQNETIARLDALKSPDACTSYNIKQDGLDIVITMMSHEDALSIKSLAKLFEIVIAQFAGSHLDAYLMQGGILLSVEMNPVEGNPMSMAQGDTELLIALALLASQLEVAMDSINIIAHREHHAQQAYRISPTRKGEDILATVEQMMLMDV
jgi:hypothetical protein